MTDHDIEVTPLVGGGYMVFSKGLSGEKTAGYRKVFGPSCTCDAGVRGVRCYHLAAVAAFCKAQDARFARPVAPPNVSALCD